MDLDEIDEENGEVPEQFEQKKKDKKAQEQAQKMIQDIQLSLYEKTASVTEEFIKRRETIR